MKYPSWAPRCLVEEHELFVKIKLEAATEGGLKARHDKLSSLYRFQSLQVYESFVNEVLEILRRLIFDSRMKRVWDHACQPKYLAQYEPQPPAHYHLDFFADAVFTGLYKALERWYKDPKLTYAERVQLHRDIREHSEQLSRKLRLLWEDPVPRMMWCNLLGKECDDRLRPLLKDEIAEWLEQRDRLVSILSFALPPLPDVLMEVSRLAQRKPQTSQLPRKLHAATARRTYIIENIANRWRIIQDDLSVPEFTTLCSVALDDLTLSEDLIRKLVRRFRVPWAP